CCTTNSASSLVKKCLSNPTFSTLLFKLAHFVHVVGVGFSCRYFSVFNRNSSSSASFLRCRYSSSERFRASISLRYFSRKMRPDFGSWLSLFIIVYRAIHLVTYYNIV